jgi:hypothetical protein
MTAAATEAPKVRPEGVKSGDVMSVTFYVKVENAHPDALRCKGLLGAPDFDIRGRELIESAHSADQFHSEEKVSRTQAVKALQGAGVRPFTVCFDKLDGTERVLRGILYESEESTTMGRSMARDLDVADDRPRQVDHRTVKWLILGGVKYTVKER